MSSRPRATIHLSAIVRNWRSLNATAKASAVVKADAYGHGAAEVSAALAAAGCDTFFVAYAEEGAVVRGAVGGDPTVYVLNGPTDGDLGLYASSNLSGVLNTQAQADLWFTSGVQQPFALKFDTGMNRLGICPSHLADVKNWMAGARPSLVMSHLACADTPENPMNSRQLLAFRALLDHFPGVPASLANSAGCFLGADYAFHLTRPGIALYGGGGHGTEPGLTLTAEILSVHTRPADETVGYGATATLTQETTLATVALGYADGIVRAGGNSGFGVLNGVRCPILGRISMDLITVDVSAAGGSAVPGARIEFLGANAPLEEQAACAGTIGYELITGLGPRVERIYER